MADHQTVIRQTTKWLSTVVIAHGLCPFAKPEFDNDRIHYAVIDAKDLETQLEQLMIECSEMDDNSDRETSLLIFPKALYDFEDYLDVLGLGTELLNAQGYDGTYQLASFHPQYRFENTQDDDPANYTNRSPYPMLHILREASVEKVLQGYPSPEKIPKRNVKVMQNLGLQRVKALFEECFEAENKAY